MRVTFNTQKFGRLLADLKRFLYETPKHIFASFVNGLIIIIPLTVTVWLLVWAFNLIDGMLRPVLVWGIGRYIPGLGFVIIVTAVIIIGYFGVKSGRRKIFRLFELQIIKIPVVGAIYGGMRQILESFTAPNGRFLEVVFMEFPRKGIYTVGLVTSEIKTGNGEKMLNVFIPTAPNPTSGFLQIVPEKDVVKSSMSINDALKLIISGGMATRTDIADVLIKVPTVRKRKINAAGNREAHKAGIMFD